MTLRHGLRTAVPALLALAVYAGTLGAGFVYDDRAIIRTNPWVHDAAMIPGLWAKPLLASPPMGTTNYYRPVVVLLYNLAWHALDGRPLAFHALNVLLHMVNATLVMMLVQRISQGSDLVPLGAAALFAVHPLGVEVVAWPSCLPELAYVTLGLSALLLHRSAWDRSGRDAGRLRLGAWIAFGLACACKETALTLLPLFVLLEIGRPALRQTRQRWSRALASAVPYVAAAALYLAARSLVLGGFLAAGARSQRSLAEAVWNAPALLLLYLKSMIFPSPLLVEHLVTLARSTSDPRFLLGASVLIALTLGVLALRRRRADLAWAACLMTFPLVPALYLPALGRDPFAERYAYLGVAGFCWLVVGGGEALLGPLGARAARRTVVASLAVLVVAGSARTMARCADWKDDRTLGTATMRVEPRAAIGYLLAGGALEDEGNEEEAYRVYERGAAVIPESTELRQEVIGLGVELGHVGRDDAIATLAGLAAASPGSATIQYNLGQALLTAGRLDEARNAFDRSLALAPGSIKTLTALAVVASQRGELDSAATYCRRALALDGRSTEALQQLGVVQLRLGDTSGAIDALERAVASAPTSKEAQNRLGVAYAKAGRLAEARRAWERALSLDPDFAGARQNLDRLRRMTPQEN